jgi:hypothetical protein
MKGEMEVLPLGVYGIVFTYDPEDMGAATMTSDLKLEGHDFEDKQYNLMMDAIESLVLAHFCSGVDVCCVDYIDGLKTAVEA